MLINMRHHCGHFKNTKKTFFVILSLFYIIIDQSIYRVLSFSFKISAKTRNFYSTEFEEHPKLYFVYFLYKGYPFLCDCDLYKPIVSNEFDSSCF